MVGFKRCPLKLVEDAGPVGNRVAKAFRMFQHYESSGNLPVAGGMAEQASTLVRVFEVAANERGRIMRDQFEARQQEAQAKAGGYR